MINEKYTSQLNLLAEAISQYSADNGCPVLVYAEAGEDWRGGSVFLNKPAVIEWIDPAPVIREVMTLWKVTSHNQKWQGITIVTDERDFRVTFDYGESWLPDEDDGDRRTPIVRAHFGDKPIYYPPLEGAEHWD